MIRITLQNLKGCDLYKNLIITVIYLQEFSRRNSIDKNAETGKT
jgi:hypothetical protein